jgi:hypothetical protein
MNKTKIITCNWRPSASGSARVYGKHSISLSWFYLYNQSQDIYNKTMCWYCGSPITDPNPIGRSARCQNCGKDLRSCKNCRFFLPGSSGDCHESGAEPQSDKERANFCDWFSLDEKYRSQTTGQSGGSEKAAASRAAFDNLFK